MTANIIYGYSTGTQIGSDGRRYPTGTQPTVDPGNRVPPTFGDFASAEDGEAIFYDVNSELWVPRDVAEPEGPNVKTDYGARGDGTTDDTAALNAAIEEASDGEVVLIPAGNYRVSSPVLLRENITVRGSHAPRWSYQGGVPCQIKGLGAFSGSAIVLVTGGIDGGRLENISIDAGAVTASSPHGLLIEGLCRDWEVANVAVQSSRSVGVRCAVESAAYPRGIRMSHVAVYNSLGAGFSFINTTDSIFEDLLAVDNGGDGIYAENPYETSFTDCRSVFNTANGFQIAGNGTTASSDSLGQTTLNNPSTDRNGNTGILIAQEGLGPVQIIAPRLRRDGSVVASSTSSAGLKVLGTSGADDAADVVVVAGTCTVGVNDGGGGDESPLFGVRVTNGGRVTLLGGDYWGVTNGIAVSGTNDYLAAPYTAFYNGVRASKAAEAVTVTGPAYTATNVTTDRSFDANTVLVAELADVVGTLIADLRTAGIVT